MTMPHLMNCDHADEGWCLRCVARLHDEYSAVLASRDALINACVKETWQVVLPSGDRLWEWKLGSCCGFVPSREEAVSAVLRTAKNYPK